MGVKAPTRNQFDEVPPVLRVIQQTGITGSERIAGPRDHPIAGMIATTNDNTIISTTIQMKIFTHCLRFCISSVLSDRGRLGDGSSPLSDTDRGALADVDGGSVDQLSGAASSDEAIHDESEAEANARHVRVLPAGARGGPSHVHCRVEPCEKPTLNEHAEVLHVV